MKPKKVTKMKVKARPEERKKPGQPTKYRGEETTRQARKACLMGATDQDLAELFDVHVDTIAEWKVVHAEFSDALKGAKAEADARVQRSLFERALGYSHPAVKILQDKGNPVVVPYTEHYPPDTTACIFWLKNRQPALWRDRVEQAISAPDGGPMFVAPSLEAFKAKIERILPNASTEAETEKAAA